MPPSHNTTAPCAAQGAQHHKVSKIRAADDITGFVALTCEGHNEPSRTSHSGSKSEEFVPETDFVFAGEAPQQDAARGEIKQHLLVLIRRP
jgi:hypothetical protein